jgi:hypothetical protein
VLDFNSRISRYLVRDVNSQKLRGMTLGSMCRGASQRFEQRQVITDISTTACTTHVAEPIEDCSQELRNGVDKCSHYLDILPKTPAQCELLGVALLIWCYLSNLREFRQLGNVPRPGQRQSVGNVERRMKTAIRRANTRLAALGIRPIDEAVTPHSLRRLYASLRFALGDDPVYVAAQLGHTEPGFSMKVYASAVRRRERLIGAALREFDAALEWAAMGSGGRVETDIEPNADDGQSPEMAQQSLFAATGPDSSAG